MTHSEFNQIIYGQTEFVRGMRPLILSEQDVQRLRESITFVAEDEITPCPYAGVFRYCDTCPVSPCPLGLDADKPKGDE